MKTPRGPAISVSTALLPFPQKGAAQRGSPAPYGVRLLGHFTRAGRNDPNGTHTVGMDARSWYATVEVFLSLLPDVDLCRCRP